MPSDTIPVFLNGRPARVPAGSTLRQLLTQEDPELAAAMAAGQATANDARGLPVDDNVPVPAGSIFKVFRSARATPGRTDA